MCRGGARAERDDGPRDDAVRIGWGVASHPGRVRDVNQDATLAGPCIFAVADGMGGHASGEVASSMLVAALAQASTDTAPTVDGVLTALTDANVAIQLRARELALANGMGTTVAGVAACSDLDDDQLLVFNVGDARTYLFRAGMLKQLSTDHSVVQELLDDGVIDADEAATHRDRHTVTRAVGMEDELRIDWKVHRVIAGDRYLVCSDGLTREVDDARIAEAFAAEPQAPALARRLLDLALEAGGRDNVSTVVVDPHAPPILTTPTSDPRDADEETVPSGGWEGGQR